MKKTIIIKESKNTKRDKPIKYSELKRSIFNYDVGSFLVEPKYKVGY